MSTTSNIETFTEWIKAHQAHDLDKLVTFLTDDIKIQSAAGANMPPAIGKDEARQHWQSIYTAFPDFRMEAVDVTSDGDTLFAEISHGGTMDGQMGPFQPTGEAYRMQGAFRFDFSDGKICSILSYWDTAAMMKQLSLAA